MTNKAKCPSRDIHDLRNEKERYRSCFACHQLLPVKRMEMHHFPIPKRHGGDQAIWLCLACHDFVDRIRIGKWPDQFIHNGIYANKESKLLLLKLWSLYTDLIAKRESGEFSDFGRRTKGEIKLNRYGVEECEECGFELITPIDGGHPYCEMCATDDSDSQKLKEDLSLSQTDLWLLAKNWRLTPKEALDEFCIEYQVSDAVLHEINVKASAILADSSK